MVQDSVSDWSQAWLFSNSPRLPLRSWSAPAAAYLETRVLPSSTTSGGLEPAKAASSLVVTLFHCWSSTLTVSLGWAFFHSALTASTTAGGALPSISQMVRVRGPDSVLAWSPSPDESPQAATPRTRAKARARAAVTRRRRSWTWTFLLAAGTAGGQSGGARPAGAGRRGRRSAAVDDGALGHGDHHPQGRVEQDQVGVLARLQAALAVVDPDRLGGVAAGRRPQLGQRPAGGGLEVVQGPVEGEDAAGQGPVGQADGAVHEEGRPAPDGVGALGQPGGLQGVADQDHALGPLGLHQQAHGGRVDVDVVGDQLAAELGGDQGSAEQPRLSMAERAHGVEGVGDVADAVGDGLEGLVVGGVAVPGGDGDAPGQRIGDQPAVLLDLGGEDQDPCDTRVEQPRRLGPVGRPDVGGVLGPGPGRVQVGPFQVGAEDGGAAVDRPGHRPHRLKGAFGVGAARGHGGRQPGGDAVGGEEPGHAGQPVRVGIHHVHPDRAVDVEVDEAGHGHQAVGGEHVGAGARSRRRLALAHGRDPPALHGDPAPRPLPTRGQHPGPGDQQPPVHVWLLTRSR